jgi:hypothetical protein
MTPTPTISASGPPRPRTLKQILQILKEEEPRNPSAAGHAPKELDLPPRAAKFVSRPSVHRSWALNRESEAAPMLPPFIIDQIRRREEEERRRIEREQPRVELPVDAYRPAPRPQPDADEPDDPERGVVILDLG